MRAKNKNKRNSYTNNKAKSKFCSNSELNMITQKYSNESLPVKYNSKNDNRKSSDDLHLLKPFYFSNLDVLAKAKNDEDNCNEEKEKKKRTSVRKSKKEKKRTEKEIADISVIKKTNNKDNDSDIINSSIEKMIKDLKI